MYASIDRFSLIPSGIPGILDFPSLAAIPSFTYSEPSYLTVKYVITLFVFVTIYVKYSTQNLLDPFIPIVVLIVLLLRIFEQKCVQLCLHTLNQTHLTSQKISESTMKTQAG